MNKLTCNRKAGQSENSLNTRRVEVSLPLQGGGLGWGSSSKRAIALLSAALLIAIGASAQNPGTPSTRAVLRVDSQNPGSLWSNSARSPIHDRLARRPGDILTVLIREVSSASASAATSSAKRDAASVDPGIGPVLRALIPGLGIGTAFSSQGQGATSRTGQLSARLTVVVKEVMPNGNLVIEGTRFVQINQETQKLIITGIVRPDDIGFDNTIFSESIAQADIRYDGKGTVGDRQRKGIISTLIDWLF